MTEISSIDRKLFTPAAGVELALSGVNELQELAKSLASDDRLDFGTQSAISEALT